jgi:hypothetical protein
MASVSGWSRFTSEVQFSGNSSPCLRNPMKCHISKEGDLLTCVLIGGWSRFTSEVRALGVSNVVLGILPEENI